MKLTVLKRMKYFVKTAYRASHDYFQNTFLWGNYGMLQGSSEVCPIWSVSSLVQFDVLDEQIPMAVFPSPRPSLYTERNSEGFVDDVTLWKRRSHLNSEKYKSKCKPKPKHGSEESTSPEVP
jgi:hypothetical protein